LPFTYWGCQKRLTFGSLPTMKFVTVGPAVVATSATKLAKAACAVGLEPIRFGLAG